MEWVVFGFFPGFGECVTIARDLTEELVRKALCPIKNTTDYRGLEEGGSKELLSRENLGQPIYTLIRNIQSDSIETGV